MGFLFALVLVFALMIYLRLNKIEDKIESLGIRKLIVKFSSDRDVTTTIDKLLKWYGTDNVCLTESLDDSTFVMVVCNPRIPVTNAVPWTEHGAVKLERMQANFCGEETGEVVVKGGADRSPVLFAYEIREPL